MGEHPGTDDVGSDACRGEVLQDVLESDLLRLGGQRLLDEAHNEAGRYVDERYPWDGRGDEPGERVSAYCAVLWQFAEHTRTEPAHPMTAAPPSRP